ncbi:MFS transporter [Nonomuraea jiangxiensis]|uniref:MFS transporter, DHA2 family, multidrug resistance protein n=1 Tax=Nonomuraea jiangxiensis TaxID=633440 RepID=A0A1G8IE10_9ACTN|nr:MFS transporter [Nonomuraea jiangxiensis]SDI17155.1 MFS transporter, DHA2 family, multidrug resistance protein [Nonomuraea jiangxiensis]
MEVTGTTPTAPAGRRAWIGVAVLTLPTLLTMMDISVLFLALPQLTTDLGASATQQLWISDIYGFLIAGFLVTMGTLGDRIGRRRVLLLGAFVFGVLSILAAFSPSAEMLIVYRAVLGIAGATIMPSTLALISGMFDDPKQRGAAIAVWSSALTLGVALGPIIGGVLLQWFWWGSVFLIAVPIMLLLLVTGPALLPESKNPQSGRLDPFSVVLSLAAILPFIYGFKEVARVGWEVTPVLIALAGVLFGVVFAVRQRKLANPLLDLSLFRVRAVGGALLLGLLIAGVQGGSGFYMSQFLQMVKGLTPLQTGLWILVPVFALLIGIGVSQGVAQKVRPAYVLAGGMVIAAIGMGLLTQLSVASGLSYLLLGFAVVYFGVAPVGPLVGQLVVPSAPPEKAGSAASLQSTSGELGVALGIALMGSIGMAAYRGDVTVPAEIAGTPAGQVAGETVAGALSVAQTLPATVGRALVDSARAAFTSGLVVTAAVCTVAFALLAVLAVVMLRQLPPMGAAREAAQAQAKAQAVQEEQPTPAS